MLQSRHTWWCDYFHHKPSDLSYFRKLLQNVLAGHQPYDKRTYCIILVWKNTKTKQILIWKKIDWVVLVIELFWLSSIKLYLTSVLHAYENDIGHLRWKYIWIIDKISFRYTCDSTSLLQVCDLQWNWYVFFLLWASYQIRKIGGCACAGNAGNDFPATVGKRSRHASRHMRDARAVMHVGIAN